MSLGPGFLLQVGKRPALRYIRKGIVGEYVWTRWNTESVNKLAILEASKLFDTTISSVAIRNESDGEETTRLPVGK